MSYKDSLIFEPAPDFNRLKTTSFYRPIKEMMKKFVIGLEKDLGIKEALVYDAIAAYYVINPKAFKLKFMDVLIETKGKYTFGMTVAEKRKKEKKNFNIQVAIKVNKQSFINDLFEILNK